MPREASVGSHVPRREAGPQGRSRTHALLSAAKNHDGSNDPTCGISAIAHVGGGEETLVIKLNRVGKRGITMIAIFVILGIVAVAIGVATGLLIRRDGAGPRPYCSGYDTRNPQ